MKWFGTLRKQKEAKKDKKESRFIQSSVRKLKKKNKMQIIRELIAYIITMVMRSVFLESALCGVTKYFCSDRPLNQNSDQLDSN